MKRLLTVFALVAAFGFTGCTRESPEPGMGTGTVGETQPYETHDTTGAAQDRDDATGAAQDGTMQHRDGVDTGTVDQRPAAPGTAPGTMDDTTEEEGQTTTY